MMHEYNVLLLNRVWREDAIRQREQHALRRLATAGTRPSLLTFATRLFRAGAASRPAQSVPASRHAAPCPPACEPLNP